MSSCCNTSGSNGPARTEAPAAARRAGAFQPNVDIFETSEEWVIAADVPGATREQLDLSFEEGVLSVKADVQPRRDAQAEFLLREYPIGNFERSFRLGHGVDPSRITAALDAGVLTIRMPKSESSKARKIEIRSN